MTIRFNVLLTDVIHFNIKKKTFSDYDAYIIKIILADIAQAIPQKILQIESKMLFENVLNFL